MSCSDVQSLKSWELTVPFVTGNYSFTTSRPQSEYTNLLEPRHE